MGTNYYWKVSLPTGEDLLSDDPRVHIGKASSAGRYCWKCRVSLCMDGEDKIHCGGGWLEECPHCGATGAPVVRAAWSFTWAQEPDQVRSILQGRPDELLVVDERGDASTGREFLRMLEAECPIQFKHSIGSRFT